MLAKYVNAMIASLKVQNQEYTVDLKKGIDLSIPLSPTGPSAWYIDPMRFTPVINDRFTGSVALGGNVNFRDVWFNPHGHGTHTETLGHITKDIISINKTLVEFFFIAKLITITPIHFEGETDGFRQMGDVIITATQIESSLMEFTGEALIIRTLPNGDFKKTRNYSNTNPPYFEPEALTAMRKAGIKHLLTDLPSVDREEDGGKLLAHHAYWIGNRTDDALATISEMIYVPDDISDGNYLLNLQTAPFENDAAPSRPVIFDLIK